jgi:endonuclease YncB( thermonuclease family)
MAHAAVIAPAACPEAGNQPVVLGRVLSGTSFTDARGVEILLAGINTPGGKGGEGDDPSAPLSQALSGHSVTAAFAASSDRYGRIPAEIFVDGVWLQNRLVRAGLARAMPDAASAACAKALLAAEDEARTKRAGHWSDGVFRVYAADDPFALSRRIGRYEIAEGKVTSAALVGDRAYLNFGTDRNTDFTVVIAAENLRGFPGGRTRIAGMTGRRVRVRGWLEKFHGPEMEIVHAEALQLLDPLTPESALFKVPRPRHKPHTRTARKHSAPSHYSNELDG